MEPRGVLGLRDAPGRLVADRPGATSQAGQPNGKPDVEPVALIVTVRNEAATIGPLLDSILSGTRAPEEIVIADGGSTDATLELLRSRAAADPRIRAVVAPGNRSVGRNAAIRASRAPIIACTDAGVEVEPEWLERITRPFAAHPDTDVVAGFYVPVGSTGFERAAGVISAPRLAEIDPARFLPSTRSIAFRRSAWEGVRGFDESLAHNEDTPFALALKRSGAKFRFEPEARVRWRPRGDLKTFFRQHRRFGFGDGESRVQSWFYGRIAAKYGIALDLLVGGFWFRVCWWLLLAGIVLFVATQARRGSGKLSLVERIALVPFLKVVYDVAYLSGYVKGRAIPPVRPLPDPDSPRASD
jgi:glycosyltransferase involved in cell wall biosynthesis